MCEILALALTVGLAVGAAVTALAVAWVSLAPMPLVCSWCRRVLRGGVGPASHGICRRCEAQLEAEETAAGRRVTP